MAFWENFPTCFCQNYTNGQQCVNKDFVNNKCLYQICRGSEHISTCLMLICTFVNNPFNNSRSLHVKFIVSLTLRTKHVPAKTINLLIMSDGLIPINTELCQQHEYTVYVQPLLCRIFSCDLLQARG